MLIDGTPVVNPDAFQVAPFDVQVSQRTASAKLVVDVVATKRQLNVQWSLIKDSDVKAILDLLATKKFHVVTYPDPQNGEEHVITACVDGDIQLASWRTIGGVRYWRDVNIPFIEQ